MDETMLIKNARAFSTSLSSFLFAGIKYNFYFAACNKPDCGFTVP